MIMSPWSRKIVMFGVIELACRAASIAFSLSLDTSSLEGRWEGSWPPRLALNRRRHYIVEVTPARRGVVAVALQRTAPTAPWRRFGVGDARLRATDSKALAQFFSAVNARAAQLLPA